MKLGTLDEMCAFNSKLGVLVTIDKSRARYLSSMILKGNQMVFHLSPFDYLYKYFLSWSDQEHAEI